MAPNHGAPTPHESFEGARWQVRDQRGWFLCLGRQNVTHQEIEISYAQLQVLLGLFFRLKIILSSLFIHQLHSSSSSYSEIGHFDQKNYYVWKDQHQFFPPRWGKMITIPNPQDLKDRFKGNLPTINRNRKWIAIFVLKIPNQATTQLKQSLPSPMELKYPSKSVATKLAITKQTLLSWWTKWSPWEIYKKCGKMKSQRNLRKQCCELLKDKCETIDKK